VKPKPEPEAAKPKSGIEQMFGKQKDKEASSKTTEKTTAEKTTATETKAPAKSTTAKKKNDIAGLFAKQVTV
jgi:hypothetical protein